MSIPGSYQPSDHTQSPAYRLPADTPPPAAYGPPPAPAPTTSRRKLWPWVAGAAAGVVVLGGAAAAVLALTGPTELEDARAACPNDRDSVRLGDGGRTLILDGRGNDSDGARPETVVCYLKELKTPDSVISQMSGTRALDGRQTAEWDGISASWTYHPDAGLDVTFTLR